jgi:hypothetical protein
MGVVGLVERQRGLVLQGNDEGRVESGGGGSPKIERIDDAPHARAIGTKARAKAKNVFGTKLHGAKGSLRTKTKQAWAI